MTYAELLAHLTGLHRRHGDALAPAGTNWDFHASLHAARDWFHRHEPEPGEQYEHTGKHVPARQGG